MFDDPCQIIGQGRLCQFGAYIWEGLVRQCFAPMRAFIVPNGWSRSLDANGRLLGLRQGLLHTLRQMLVLPRSAALALARIGPPGQR